MYFSDLYGLYLATEGRKDLIIDMKSTLITPTFWPNESLGREIQEIVCVCVFFLNFLIKVNIRGYSAYNE